MAMEAPAVLIRATVYDPVTATTKVLNFANRDDPRVTTWNNEAWRPILMKSPSISMSVFNGDFSGSGGISVSGFSIMLLETDLDTYPQFTWHGAKIEVYAGDADSGSFTKVATVVGNGANREGRVGLLVEVKTYDELFDRNILFFSYAGTGDIEGTADIKGVLKPAVFGDAKNCQPVLIDPVRQIYQVHGYGPVEAIYAVYEGGAAIGTGGNPAAAQTGTYVTFRDTVVAQGQWIRHNNLGLIKLGSQPSFPISVDVKGDTNGVNSAAALRRPGAVIKRLIELNTSAIPLKASSFTNFDALAPYDVDLYIEDQTVLSEAVQYVLRSVGGYWSWDEDGRVILGLMRFTTSTVTLSGLNDQEPTVLTINQLATSAPVWSLRIGGAACHYVHDASSIVQSIVSLNAADATNAQSISDLANVTSQVFPPSSTPPVGAVDGDMWPDTSTIPPTLRRFNGATWVSTATVGAVVGTSLVLSTGVPVPSAELLNSSLVLSTTGGLTYGSGAAAVAVGAITNLDFVNVGNASGTRPANNATVGADVNSNVIDTGSGLGNELLPRALVRTSLGYSAGFNGEGVYARRNYYRLGETGGGSGEFGAGLTEGSAEWTSNALLRTPSGVSSGFAGQNTLASRRFIRIGQTENGSGELGALLTDSGEWSTNALLRTPSGVSSGFVGQRNLATRHFIQTGLTDFSIEDRAGLLLDGATEWANNTLIRTASGIASSVANQQRLATKDRVNFGFDAGIASEANSYWVSDANAITSLGIASGFSGQKNMATTEYTKRPDGRLHADNVQFGDQTSSSLNDLKPGEAGANITENRVASSIVGQNAYAKKNYFVLGQTGGGTGDQGAGLTEGAAEWTTNSLLRTPSGIASSIANQKDWATYDGINTTTMAGRVSRQGNDGRVSDPRIYNTQNLLGPSNTTGLVPTYTNNGTSITVNFPAHNRFIAGPGGPIALYYGAGSFNVGYGSYWIAFIDDPNMVGIGAPSIGFTTGPNDLLYPGRYQVASGYAPAADGGGGSTGGGGGGGGFSETCVSAGAFVAVERYDLLMWIIAADVVAGDHVWTMLDANTAGWTGCTGNKVVLAHSVRLTLDSGRTIECSRSTPITQPDMSTVLAEDALGSLAAQNSWQGIAWGAVVLVEDIGIIDVAHLSCNDGTYLAAMIPGEGIFTHNATIKP